MKYQVVWQPCAKRQLAAIWNSANDRRAVTAAADEIDRLLAVAPNDVGESCAEDTRIVIIEPLAMYFRVDETKHVVRVGRVLQFGQRY